MKTLLLILLIGVILVGLVSWFVWAMGWYSTEVVVVDEDEDEYIDPVPGFIAGAMIGGAVGAIAAEEIIEDRQPVVVEDVEIEENDGVADDQ